MHIQTQRIQIGWKEYTLKLLFVEKNDRPRLRELYSKWISYSRAVKDFKGRFVNLAEALSESAFSLEFGFPRVLEGGPFDTLDLKNRKRQQVKACSVEEDLTSFSPSSNWDEFYFLDFFRKGNWDRTFDVYLIPNDLIFGTKVSSTETFFDQQKQGRRPRFSIKKEIIHRKNLRPIKTCVL